MKRTQAFIWLFLIGLTSPVITQEIEKKAITLTLSDAINQTLNNHPSLQIRQSEIDRSFGQKMTVGLLPNPMFSFYHENLDRSGQSGGETTLLAGLPLNFLWSRWSQIATAEAQIETGRYLLSDARRLLRFEVQKAFVTTHFASENLLAWQKAAEVFARAQEAGRARLADGDIAGYDQQRISIESFRYQRAEAEAHVRFLQSRKQLAFLLDSNHSEKEIQTSGVFPTRLPEISLEEMMHQSLKSRPDLLATRSRINGRRSAVSASKWDRFPEIIASAGYKTQMDDFKGPVFQLSARLPLFNRNQGDVTSATATLHRDRLSMELKEDHVELEVRQAYETFQIYRRQVDALLGDMAQPPEVLLETARFSYIEGEMSLVELLDGARAYSEYFQSRNDLLLKYQLSLFELEKAAAVPITGY